MQRTKISRVVGAIPRRGRPCRKQKTSLQKWLRTCPFFRRCSQAFLDEMCDTCIGQACFDPDGQPIYLEGETGGSMFIILSGFVELSLANSIAPATHLTTGDFFGEMNVMGVTPLRSATARAVSYLNTSIIHRAPLVKLMKAYPEEGYKVQRAALGVFTPLGQVLPATASLLESWDIMNPPEEHERDEEILTLDRMSCLKSLVNTVLGKVGCDPLNKTLRDDERSCGMSVRPSPVPTPSPTPATPAPLRDLLNSSRLSRPMSVIGVSDCRPHSSNSSRRSRYHSSPSNNSTFASPLAITASSSPTSFGATPRDSDAPLGLPRVAGYSRRHDDLASKRYAATSFERSMVDDTGDVCKRPQIPGISQVENNYARPHSTLGGGHRAASVRSDALRVNLSSTF